MNIFYLDKTPEKAAQYHNDKHVVKMILETAQLLSTAHRVLNGKLCKMKTKTGRWKSYYNLHDHHNSILYSATHVNHPSAIWARQSLWNYVWLADLLNELCAEYTYRYGKVHKVEASGLLNTLLINIPKGIPDVPFTEPTPAMPDDCKVPNDSIASYRKYYMTNKSHLAHWKNRNVPSWYSVKG